MSDERETREALGSKRRRSVFSFSFSGGGERGGVVAFHSEGRGFESPQLVAH